MFYNGNRLLMITCDCNKPCKNGRVNKIYKISKVKQNVYGMIQVSINDKLCNHYALCAVDGYHSDEIELINYQEICNVL